jgi:hypothetical protein
MNRYAVLEEHLRRLVVNDLTRAENEVRLAKAGDDHLADVHAANVDRALDEAERHHRHLQVVKALTEKRPSSAPPHQHPHPQPATSTGRQGPAAQFTADRQGTSPACGGGQVMAGEHGVDLQL